MRDAGHDVVVSEALDDPSPSRVLVHIALLSLAARAALWAVGLASAGDPARWLDLWSAWDASHILRLAEVGYRPLEPAVTGDDGLFIVYFPLYPLLVRGVATIVRHLVGAGLIVSYVAAVAGAWFLYRIARSKADHATAWRTVVLLLAFPTAYFMAAPYTEALFLAAVTASMYAARIGRWPLAAAAGAAATATRVSGAAVLAGLGVQALSGPLSRRTVVRLAWSAAAAAGGGIYLAINWAVHSDPFFFLYVQRSHWNQELVPPWTSMWLAVEAIGQGAATGDFAYIFWGRIAAFVFAAAVLVAGWRVLQTADRAYGWASLILVLPVSWLISLPRYLMVIYPLFIVGGHLTKRRPVFAAVVVAGSLAQAYFFWRYARGWWTF